MTDPARSGTRSSTATVLRRLVRGFLYWLSLAVTVLLTSDAAIAQDTITYAYISQPFDIDFCLAQGRDFTCQSGSITGSVTFRKIDVVKGGGTVGNTDPSTIPISFAFTTFGYTFTESNSCFGGEFSLGSNGQVFVGELTAEDIAQCSGSQGTPPHFFHIGSRGDLVEFSAGQDSKTGYTRQPGLWTRSTLQIASVEPVPTLLTGVNWTASPTDPRIITGGRSVRGVAADGTAEILLRITGVTVGQQVTLSLPALVSPGDLQGALRTLDSPTEFSQVTVTGQNTSPPMAFAVYRAPMDFSDGLSNTTTSERSIMIHAQANGVPAVDTPIAIVRPTLILVHGLWDSSSAWRTFTPLINASWLDTYLFNYRSTNADTFLVNANLLADRLFSLREQVAADKNIAAAQFDFVAHSMGGNIVRYLVPTGLAATPWTLRKGYIHKLITLGTPHLGSPLARELVKPENACVADSLAMAGLTVKNPGAVGDLVGNGDGTGMSNALQLLAPAPTGMMGGRLAASQLAGLSFVRSSANWWCHNKPAPLINMFTAENYSSILGTQHDGIVPVTSALNNHAATANLLWGDGTSVGAVHSAGAKWLGISGPLLLTPDSPFALRVVDLLNTPISSQDFVK